MEKRPPSQHQNRSSRNRIAGRRGRTNGPGGALEASLSKRRINTLRLYSEFENYKNGWRDQFDQSRMAAADTWSAILPVIDDFERAIKAMESKAAADPALDGIRLIYSKLKSITEGAWPEADGCDRKTV